jgi:hypothetical protein
VVAKKNLEEIRVGAAHHILGSEMLKIIAKGTAHRTLLLCRQSIGALHLPKNFTGFYPEYAAMRLFLF